MPSRGMKIAVVMKSTFLSACNAYAYIYTYIYMHTHIFIYNYHKENFTTEMTVTNGSSIFSIILPASGK